MECNLRKWRMEDKEELARLLNNPKILQNLRDGIPYPYRVKDAEEFIGATLAADENQTIAFAITAEDRLIGRHRGVPLREYPFPDGGDGLLSGRTILGKRIWNKRGEKDL